MLFWTETFDSESQGTVSHMVVARVRFLCRYLEAYVSARFLYSDTQP